MSKTVKLSVYGIVGSELCVSSDDGDKVFKLVEAALNQEARVELSFRNVKSLTSAFLNSAIGQLYGVFDHELIKTRISLRDLSPEDKALLKRVVDTAKSYFSNRKQDAAATRRLLDGDDS